MLLLPSNTSWILELASLTLLPDLHLPALHATPLSSQNLAVPVIPAVRVQRRGPGPSLRTKWALVLLVLSDQETRGELLLFLVEMEWKGWTQASLDQQLISSVPWSD